VRFRKKGKVPISNYIKIEYRLRQYNETFVCEISQVSL